MKTRIQKIIMIAAAMIFVGSGVSFAHDWNDRHQKPAGKAYGHNQVKKVPPGRTHKNFKPHPPITKRYVVYRGVPDHRHFDNHDRRPEPPEGTFIKFALNESMVAFEIIVKDRR